MAIAPFHAAAQEGQLALVNRLFDDNPCVLHSTNSYGWTGEGR